MTEELKTLKDFKCECWGCEEYGSHTDKNDKAINVEDLRQEAINHLKVNKLRRQYLSRQMQTQDPMPLGAEIGAIMMIDAWIIYFFNIIDKELK